MNEALTSRYIIDGVPQELTPAQILGSDEKSVSGTVIDESSDPSLESHIWEPGSVDRYASKISRTRRKFPLPYSSVFTRCRMAETLLDALWCSGHFCLEDLSLKVLWKWNTGPVGSQAAFYRSVQAVGDYSDALGVEISGYGYEMTAGDCKVRFEAGLRRLSAADDEMAGDPSKVEMRRTRTCPGTLQPDPSSWLIYVPFDTSDYRLGGSLLSQAMNYGGGVSPQIEDADYFMDCFEVVRELVEDGIVMAGITVGEGGLLAAARELCVGGPGTVLDLSDAMRAFEESNPVRVLFAEVPGVIIQVRDNDFDYIDAELLLQDVAFYPLGHPSLKSLDVRVRASAKSSIETILESLMQNAEGED